MGSHDASVITIDCHYIQPQAAAAYLLIGDGKAAFIDNNTNRAIPRLLDALKQAGLTPEDVVYAIVTHVHLDHAGGTAALAAACPRAEVLVHPRGARHMKDPSRLVQGAKEVYGEARFAELYGEIEPVPENRIRVVEDGDAVRLGDRELVVLDTPGHAKHHHCVYDPASEGVFTGDTFGVFYPVLPQGERPLVMASSAPVDFDPDAALNTIQRLVDTGAKRAFLSHFGCVEGVPEAAASLTESVKGLAAVFDEAVQQGLEGDTLLRFCEEGVRKAHLDHLARCGVPETDLVRAWTEGDIRINAQGVAVAAARRMATKA